MTVPNDHRSGRLYARGAKPVGLQPMMLADGATAEIRLYDAIDSWGDPWGVSAKDFAGVLDELGDVKTINLRINSPGGEVWDALAIMNMLRSHPATVTATVDGIAASSASFIAASADRTVMMPQSEMMVHLPFGIVLGPADDMRKMAADLDHEAANIASVYADKSGSTVADWLGVMASETWLTAAEAVESGLADEVASKGDAAQPSDRFNLNVFNYAGREHAPAPKTPVARASGQPSKEGDATMAFLDDVRQRLGVTDASADESVLLAALDEVLSEQSDDTPKPADAVPDGMVLVSQAKWDEAMTSHDALAGQVKGLLDEKAKDRREATVKAAIKQGKIMPAEKQAYLNALEMDEDGTVQRLDALTPGLVPLAELGHSGGADEGTGHTPGWSDSLFADLHPEQKAS